MEFYAWRGFGFHVKRKKRGCILLAIFWVLWNANLITYFIVTKMIFFKFWFSKYLVSVRCWDLLMGALSFFNIQCISNNIQFQMSCRYPWKHGGLCINTGIELSMLNRFLRKFSCSHIMCHCIQALDLREEACWRWCFSGRTNEYP